MATWLHGWLPDPLEAIVPIHVEKQGEYYPFYGKLDAGRFIQPAPDVNKQIMLFCETVNPLSFQFSCGKP
jgi:hypothetical protein